MQPKKEEKDEEEMRVACKKAKIRTEENGTVKHTKTKKTKTSVKNEKAV